MKTTHNHIAHVCLIVLGIFSENSYAITDALKIRIARASYSDETIIRFVAGATKDFDGNYDAWKLFSFNASVPNIFSKDIVNDELSINAMPEFTASVSHDVFLKIGTAGTYSITPSEEGAFASGICITMRDNTTGQLYDMRAASTFTVSLPVIAQTAAPRFTVFFNLPGTVSYYSSASGNWSSAATWSSIACAASPASVPDSISNIVISSGTVVTLDAAAVCTDISVNGTLSASAPLAIKGDLINRGTFTAGTQTVTFKGNSLQTISGKIINFNNLTINNTAPSEALRLYIPVNVNRILGLKDGHITTASATILTCGAAASIALLATPQDSSFVKGPMKHTVNVDYGVTKIFPVGKNNSFRRSDLTVDQQTSALTTYTSEMVDNSAQALGYSLPPSLSNVSQVRYHVITQSPAATVDMAQARIYFGCAGIDDEVKTLIPISVAKDDGAGSWIDLTDTPFGFSCGGSYWGNSLSGTFTSFTGTKFALGNTGPPVILPVTLVAFHAAAEGNSVKVFWETESEMNSDYFSVERSKDGKQYDEIGRVNAAGNSSEEKKYTLYDESPYNGTSYYRLKSSDRNGTFSYSQTVSINIDEKNSISAYPNPASDYLAVSISGNNGKESQIIIRDVLGKECYSQKYILASDNEIIRVDIQDKFAKGIYSVEAISWGNSSVQKIIIH